MSGSADHERDRPANGDPRPPDDDDERDPVQEADEESFPASDPPSTWADAGG